MAAATLLGGVGGTRGSTLKAAAGLAKSSHALPAESGSAGAGISVTVGESAIGGVGAEGRRIGAADDSGRGGFSNISLAKVGVARVPTTGMESSTGEEFT